MFSIARAATTTGAVGLGSVMLKNPDVVNNIWSVKAADCKEPMYVGDVIKKRVGFPQPTACCKPLRFKDFIISYDSRNRIPNWVYEHLHYDMLYKEDPCDRRPKVERSQCAR